MRLPPKLLFLSALACIAVSHLGRAAVPAACLVVQNGTGSVYGTVYDARSKLTWQQGVIAGGYTWAQASTQCQTLALNGGGWRLPSIMELQTIVDDSRINPSIDPVAFPATPGVLFWTSSAVSGSAGAADGTRDKWTVSFANGATRINLVTSSNLFRCVR